MNAEYEAFERRYEMLKRLYFSRASDPQYDEEGQELPSASLSKQQIVDIFLKQMRVHIPRSPQDPIQFLG